MKFKYLRCLFITASIYLFLYQLPLFAQYTANNYIPVSPEAMDFAEYGKFPVNLSTGIMSVSIPIFSLKDKTESLNISLENTTSGVLVSSLGSYLGPGWSLAAGGAITRITKGNPDADNLYSTAPRTVGSQLPTIPGETLTSWLIDNAEYLHQVEIGLIDTQADIFSIQAPGMSARFYLDENLDVRFFDLGTIICSKNGIKDGDNLWEFINGNGTEYSFNQIEYTHQFIGTEISVSKTAWYLSGITYINGDHFTFSYDDKLEIYEPTYSDNFTFESRRLLPEFTIHHTVSKSRVQIRGQTLLKSIQSNRGKVVFNYSDSRPDMIQGYRLENIQINYLGDDLYKSYILNYALSSNRSQLTSVTESGSDGTILPPYEFSYYGNGLPPIDSKAQDLMGLYNGKTGNTNLIPYVKPIERSFNWADRSPNLSSAQWGSLKTITYPTGGSSTLEYELNDYFDPEDPYKIITDDEQLEATLTSSTDEYLLHVSSKGALIDLVVDFREAAEWMPEDLLPYASITSDSYNKIYELANYNSGSQYRTDQLNLSEGDYIFKVDLPCVVDGSCTSSYSSAKFLFHVEMESDSEFANKVLGGLRIEKIINYDQIRHQSLVREFKYIKEFEGHDVSSGVLSIEPKYSYSNYLVKVPDSHINEDLFCKEEVYSQFHILANNVSFAALDNGSPIYYSHIIESKISNDGASDGYIEHNYSVPENTFYIDRWPFISHLNENFNKYGLNLSEGIFTDASDQIRLAENHYTQVSLDDPNYYGMSSLIVGRNIDLVGQYCRNSDGEPQALAYEATEFLISKEGFHNEWTRLDWERMTINDGQNPYSKQTNYEYGNLQHRQVTEEYFTDSQGKIQSKIYKYAQDFNDQSLGANLLIEKNVVNTPLLIEEKVDDEIFKTTTSTYNLFGNNLELTKFETLKGGQGISTTEFSYDQNGRITELKNQDGIVNSFKWINNFSPSFMATGMNFSQLDDLYTQNSGDPNDMIAEVAADCEEITYFDQDPLNGLNSTINTNGRQSTFEYNSLGRFIKAYDHDQKLLRQYVYSYSTNNGLPNSLSKFQALTSTNSDLTQINNSFMVNQQIDYVDGLGRKIQTVSKSASPQFKDIVQPIWYDEFGIASKEYLPFVGLTDNGLYYNNALGGNDYTTSDQYNFFTSNSSEEFSSSFYPYSYSIYENSPLHRIIERGSPGATWQPITQENSSDPTVLGKTQTTEYLNNIAGEVIDWHLENGSLSEPEYYDAGELTKTVTHDENNHETIVYKDKLNRTVLNRVGKDENGNYADTYYVYGDDGLLYFVLPPELSEIISSSLPNTELLDKWAFQYKYDNRDRMIEKKVPGAEVQYMAYDKRDRLVLSQDGNQRQSQDWLYTKYDTLNRPISTGLINLGAATPTSLNADIFEDQSIFSESRDPNQTNGYTDVSFPTAMDGTNIRDLSYTYYDTYPSNWSSSLNFVHIDDLSRTIPQGTYEFDNAAIAVKGQITATKTLILTSDLSTADQWVWTTNFYDKKYRLIQSVMTNDYLETTDRISTLYSFTGWVLETRLVHDKTGQISKEIRRQYNYDHAGRLLEGYHELLVDHVSQGKVLLAQDKYNELGQLIEKNLHIEGGNAPLQSIDYRYNIRGWLQSINQASLLENPGVNPDDPVPDYFGMELQYDHLLNINPQ